MDTATLKRHLRQFGLSEKEVDTYLTILEHGSAKASEVAEAAGVSKRYVYSVSEELEERGFVEVDDHVVPTTIRANPPGSVMETLQSDLTSIGPALEKRYSAAEPTGDQFEVIKSRVTVLKRMCQRVENATGEVILSVPADRLDEIAPALEAAVDRGVLVVLVVSNVRKGEEPALEGLASVGRVWGQPMPSMVTADQAEGLVAPAEMITRSEGEHQAIAFAQKQLAPVIIGSFFGNYWPNAEESYNVAPAALPHTFEEFRHAVFQATLHLRAGKAPAVTVEGTLLSEDEDGAGERIELEGRIVDTRQGLVEPFTNGFPVENALVVETEDGKQHTVGGPGAFVEDIEADTVTLREL
ncbi:TrmB family transcriptional regulator [Halolamina sp.]|jgi:sugar-specific transcriptional regulator TrmB|uniref:TrmB family transcriptional regulator n=1 Tax=Halolamina sp. TaxID=1940283 RepID=UPI0035683713